MTDGARNDQAVNLTVALDAPPAGVWHALTEADALMAWYWPASLEPQARTDPRPGGRYAITSSAPGMGIEGEYVALDAPHRLVQTFRWAGDDADSLVTIELNPSGDGTELRLRHEHLDALTAVNYRAGWESCLERLPGYLTSH